MKNRIVVYTAITGGYDKLKEVSCPEEGVDYICITDSNFSGKVPFPWQHVSIPSCKLSNKDLARYCKIMSHKLLPQYDVSIWIDGNISIKGSMLKLIEDEFGDELVASYDHWGRRSVYEEMKECLKIGHDFYWTLRKQANFYKSENFISDTLFENNVVIRSHKNDKVRKMNEEWLKQYQIFGKRDQYSYTYSAFKNDINILSLGEHDPRLVKNYFDYHIHEKNKHPAIVDIRKLINMFFIKLFGVKCFE
ncbi:DUF616 domain-containing protein [Vibrio sp. Vb2853]|uniref:glycosyltransferase domain-containing protein n=1 Tax=Vibrio TaxID=662 RepID=UPI001BD3B776|nr:MULTISPECIES: glycosyltransferase domain-containing protein [Vibrio]MBS9892364.1 DUF616 domain-containing protein [Vibrio alginolyticus]MDW1613612.1 DUF616 domain-containing protein [Vibrio sp. Vb2881]MDW1618328.1 DUF616 domain-containing protein [Vibrio sp. Vb2864]MDW1690561.1 DUF616 domain-containing protein [Vibrio sp. Vb2853]MDW1709172.1 DUF616 domain-containing protein [Vibrio sp. Vb2865]